MVEKLSPPELARKTVETYITKNIIPEPSDFKVTGVDLEQAGTFVSVKKDTGDLRGCIGTVMPIKKTIEEEIIGNAISASTKDPRFPAIKAEELDRLVYSVDVMGKIEPVQSASDLNPKMYGCIVQSLDGQRQGLLLPHLDGVDTIEDQIAICRRKGKIPNDEPVRLYRFKADRYFE